MSERKIFVIGGSINYTNWMEGTLVDKMEDADLVVLTGGEDVDPRFYNEKKGQYTNINTRRDLMEIDDVKKAIELKKYLIGICRGSQLLCTIAKGRLIQHQQNKEYYHSITTNSNEKILVTSTHHQAAYPFQLPSNEYTVIGWTNGLSEYHLSGEEKEMNPRLECEIVYYSKIKALGIQGHPESMYMDKGPRHIECRESILYFQKLLNNFMKDKLK